MTNEQKELFKDLHYNSFSDFCLKDGELAQIAEHIHFVKIKKDLIKKEKWNWFKNILNFNKDKK